MFLAEILFAIYQKSLTQMVYCYCLHQLTDLCGERRSATITLDSCHFGLDNVPVPAKTPGRMGDHGKMHRWLLERWLPLVPALFHFGKLGVAIKRSLKVA